MASSQHIGKNDIANVLAYAGLTLIAFELVQKMIVWPIKVFYRDTTFGEGLPFKCYEVDVLSRHKNEFEACLLYLQDFVEAIDVEDVTTIQELRKHRNELAHDLASRLSDLNLEQYEPLFGRVDRMLRKLSRYRAYMEVGADPQFQGIDWENAVGGEYLLFAEILEEVKLLDLQRSRQA